MEVELFDNEKVKLRNISSLFLTMKESEIGKTKGTSYRGLSFSDFLLLHGKKNGLKLKGGKHAVLIL